MDAVYFEKVLIGVSCLCFIIVFAAVVFCLTDFKLCFRSGPVQKIFNDEVLTNTAALEHDSRNSRSDSKINKTHPISNEDGISEKTIDLGTEACRNVDSNKIEYITEDNDSIKLNKDVCMSGISVTRKKSKPRFESDFIEPQLQI